MLPRVSTSALGTMCPGAVSQVASGHENRSHPGTHPLTLFPPGQETSESAGLLSCPPGSALWSPASSCSFVRKGPKGETQFNALAQGHGLATPSVGSTAHWAALLAPCQGVICASELTPSTLPQPAWKDRLFSGCMLT